MNTDTVRFLALHSQIPAHVSLRGAYVWLLGSDDCDGSSDDGDHGICDDVVGLMQTGAQSSASSTATSTEGLTMLRDVTVLISVVDMLFATRGSATHSEIDWWLFRLRLQSLHDPATDTFTSTSLPGTDLHMSVVVRFGATRGSLGAEDGSFALPLRGHFGRFLSLHTHI